MIRQGRFALTLLEILEKRVNFASNFASRSLYFH